MEDAYENWRKQKTPENLATVVDAASPVINSALTSYAGGNTIFRGQAKRLVAEAVQSYDPKQGVKLKTYLHHQLQPLTRIARQHTQAVRVPERITMDNYHITQAHQRFFDEHGREPTDDELADFTGYSTKRIAHVRKLSKFDMPESAITARNEEGEQETYYPGVDQVDPQRVWMEFVHHDLAPVDKKILEWKTGIYGKQILSTNEIAKRLKLSPGAVSQRAARISARLAEGKSIDI